MFVELNFDLHCLLCFLQSGQRRRTKGGTFLTLLKTQFDLPKETIDKIFAEEEAQYQEWKKKRRNFLK